jgi:hypothetical protein
MTSPPTAKQRAAGKEKVDDLICLCLVGIEPDRTCFPQIDQIVTRVRHGLDQLEVPRQPSFLNDAATRLRLCEALSVPLRVVLAAFKNRLHKSLIITASEASFFLVLDQYWRLDFSVLFLAHRAHRRLGA